MPPKHKKQKTKHSKPSAPNQKNNVGGQPKHAKGGRSQSAIPARRICTCVTVGFKDGDLHGSGKHDPLTPTLNSGFLSIRIDNLRTFAAQNQLELESGGARRWLVSKGQLQSAIEEQIRIKEQKRLEAERIAEEERRRFQASLSFAGFLSFKYGRTVEERRSIGHWLADQLVIPQSDLPQTNSVATSVPLSEVLNVLDSSIAPAAHTNAFSGLPSNHHIDITHTIPDIPSHQVSVPVERPPSPPGSATSNRYALRKLSVQTPSSEPSTPTDTGPMSNQAARDLTGGVDASIKDLIQQLFFLQQHVSQFRNEKHSGLINQAEEVARSIGRLEDQVTRPDNPLHNVTVAPEIIDYVEDGRNPDIFTRDFVELVARGNSVMNGKQKAFKDFSKIYAKALKDNFEGLDEEVDSIMEEAGLVEKNGKFVEKGLQNGNST